MPETSKSRLSVTVTIAAVLVSQCLSSDASSDVRVEEPAVYVTGQIDADDLEVVRGATGASIVFLDSSGGSVTAAIAIGRVMRSRQWAAIVPPAASCLSSCSLLYIAAVERSNDGIIGLHRPYFAGEPQTADELRVTFPSLLSEIRDYVAEMGVVAAFADIIVNTPPEQMRAFDGDAIRVLVPDEDPLYGEMNVAVEARRRGISTDEYRRRNADAEARCSTFWRPGFEVEAWDCREATRWGLAISTYRERRTLATKWCALSSAEWDAIEAMDGGRQHPLVAQQERCELALYGSLKSTSEREVGVGLLVPDYPFGLRQTREDLLRSLRAAGITPDAGETRHVQYSDEIGGQTVGGFLVVGITHTFGTGAGSEVVWVLGEASEDALIMVDAIITQGYGPETRDLSVLGLVRREHVVGTMRVLHVFDRSAGEHFVHFRDQAP